VSVASDIANLRIEAADISLKLIKNPKLSDDDDFSERHEQCKKKVNSQLGERHDVLTYILKVPMKKTSSMDSGINFKFYNKAMKVFQRLNEGGDAVSKEGFWEGTQEPIMIISGDISLLKWEECIDPFREFLKEMQRECQQQCVYIKIGDSMDTPSFFEESITAKYPEQSEFITLDPAFDDDELKTQIVHNHNYYGDSTVNFSEITDSLADLETSPTNLNPESIENADQKEIFRDYKRQLVDKLGSIARKEGKHFEERVGNEDLLDEIESIDDENKKLELMLTHKDGPLLFICMFKKGIQLDEASLRIIGCQEENGKIDPRDENFFSNIKFAFEISEKAESIKAISDKTGRDLEDLNVAQSLIECVVGERKLEPNHPVINRNNFRTKFQQNIDGKGTQIDALRARYHKLTWGMDDYIRDPAVIRDYYNKFTNFPFLAISGIGGVGKTALMMKLVWDSIKEDPKKFDHYLILTSKGTDQGSLILLPGKKMVDYNFTKKSTIGKYFRSFSEFINHVAIINRSYDPERDYHGTDKLADLAVEAMEQSKILLVIDNFEDFEDDHSDYQHFVKFFESFNEIKNPESRILLTTRGDGDVANYAKDLTPLGPSDTATLFVRRLEWLLQEKHYKNVNPAFLVDLITKIREELISIEDIGNTDHSRNGQKMKKIMKAIGHPATVLLLAASLNDSNDSNPLSYFTDELDALKEGKIGAGDKEFYRYCVEKALTSQKEFPWLKQLVHNLTGRSTFSAQDIKDDFYRLQGDEISAQNIDQIIKLLIRYSFVEKTDSQLTSSYMWTSWAQEFLNKSQPNKITDKVFDSDENNVTDLTLTSNRIEELSQFQSGQRNTRVVGGRHIHRQVAAKSGEEPINHSLRKIAIQDKIEDILSWKTQKHLDLSVKFYVSSTKFIENGWTKLQGADSDAIKPLMEVSFDYLVDFNQKFFEYAEDEDNEFDIGKFVNGIPQSQLRSWHGLTRYYSQNGFENKNEEKSRKAKIISQFEEITVFDVVYDNKNINDANVLLREIYNYRQFANKDWKLENENDKKIIIENAQSWIKVFTNLDKNNPRATKDLIPLYANLCLNLAINHHNHKNRKEFLKSAEANAQFLHPAKQHTIGRLKDNEETGYFTRDNLIDLDLAIGIIPVGTTILLDEDPELYSKNLYRLVIISKKAKTTIERRFKILFNDDSIQSGNKSYLVDVIKVNGNILTVRARRNIQGKLIPVRKPSDNIVNRNWMVLEDQILNWAEQIIQNGLESREKIEELANKSLLKTTKMENLDKLKSHLKFVHPVLANCNSTFLATMIVLMSNARRDGIYSFKIDNDFNLSNIIGTTKRTTNKKPTNVEPSNLDKKLHSREDGLSLPNDPEVMAGLLVNFYGSPINLKVKKYKLRATMRIWLDKCRENDVSKGKGKRLFHMISHSSDKLGADFWRTDLDADWNPPLDVENLSNRCFSNMKVVLTNRKDGKKLIRPLKKYFTQVNSLIRIMKMS
jgi:hypothetical protein